MPRPFTPKVITANALLEGDVVYLTTADTWSDWDVGEITAASAADAATGGAPVLIAAAAAMDAELSDNVLSEQCAGTGTETRVGASWFGSGHLVPGVSVSGSNLACYFVLLRGTDMDKH